MTEQNELSKDEVAKRRREAYGAANTRLREAQRKEFEDLYQQECEARGIPYTHKATPEEKAEQDLASLIEHFPHLKKKIADLIA